MYRKKLLYHNLVRRNYKMPRPVKNVEKVKDLKGTLIRIFNSLKLWRYVLVLSCVLAMVAAILSTVAPNKLADVTDVISEGIKPRVENMELISKKKTLSSVIRPQKPICWHSPWVMK